MALYGVDWSAHLSGGTFLNPDIRFRVVPEEKNQYEENPELEDIPVHKFLLASVSDVFATMFFGDMKEKGDVVELKDSTMMAVKVFFDYIYKKPGTVQIDNMSVWNIFHLYKLADRYRMVELMEIVKDVLKKKELTKENVMEVAAVAENFLIMFEDISKELQKRCGNFLAKNLPTFTEVQEFLQKSDDDFDLNLFKKLVIQANKKDVAYCSCGCGWQITETI